MTAKLPSLREVVEAHGLGARKALGQHFLLDMNITRKIVRLGGINAGDHVIEVGPGPGGLTRALLEQGARVTAIERDDRCLDILDELARVWPSQLTVLNEDALDTDFTRLATPASPAKFASNLPYNISTELLVRWLTLTPGSWPSMTLMFQREVADRIIATHGSKTFGRLSVLSQIVSTPVRSYDLPAKAFTPPPKVDSSVVTFSPLAMPFHHLPMLEHITRAAFSQRRKMVRSSLKPVFGEKLESALTAAGIAMTARAEDIAVVQYASLTKLAAQLK